MSSNKGKAVCKIPPSMQRARIADGHNYWRTFRKNSATARGLKESSPYTLDTSICIAKRLEELGLTKEQEYDLTEKCIPWEVLAKSCSRNVSLEASRKFFEDYPSHPLLTESEALQVLSDCIQQCENKSDSLKNLELPLDTRKEQIIQNIETHLEYINLLVSNLKSLVP